MWTTPVYFIYYSEKRRKFQAICLDFEKQKGFFREEKGVEKDCFRWETATVKYKSNWV